MTYRVRNNNYDRKEDVVVGQPTSRVRRNTARRKAKKILGNRKLRGILSRLTPAEKNQRRKAAKISAKNRSKQKAPDRLFMGN